LRRRGIDVLTLTEASLLGASDERLLAHALAERRVIVTHDSDFLRLHAQGMRHAGIVYCEQGSRTIRELVSGLVLVYEALEAEDLVRHVEFL
jgi:predicted nuclease of predicted toxin-antitoxin system